MTRKSMFVAIAAVGFVAIGAEAPDFLAGHSRYQAQVDVKVGGFWGEKYKMLVTKWIPHCIREMEVGGEGEELLNLVHAGEFLAAKNAKRAKFKGCKWSDAYPYNIIEAALLALELDTGDDAELKAGQDFLRKKIEEWIPIILSAQEPSGYIDSYTLLNGMPHFTKAGDHEFYVMGYFIEMGIAHHRATGDRRLLDAAMRCADHLDSVFGPPPKRTWMNGHPGLEYALCRLSDATGEAKYARLAQYMVRNQHATQNKNDYCQSERPAVEMSEAKGHAVRANYFYAAMAAIANRLDDKPLGDAAARLFDSVVDRKYYLTGGVGDDYKKEAYGRDYTLPQKAYAESCAGCGLEFFAREVRQLVGSDKAEAVRERVIFNNVLGAISRDGTRFYYQNPLSSDTPRYTWHKCPCCVGNVPRTLLALKDTVFSVDGETLYVNQYMDIENAKVTVGGVSYTVSMKTDYPVDGKVMLCASFPAGIKVFVRFPNRAESALYKAEPEVEHGYKEFFSRKGRKESEFVWELPLPEQKVTADERVESCRGKVAYQKGPIVYSWENGKKLPNYDRLNEGGVSEVWTPSECSITVSDKVRFPVAPDMWGIFFEDIDLSLDGGIYAEMVRNRSFEEGKLGREQNEPLAWWDPVGAAYLSADVSKPLSRRNARCVRVEARPGAGIANQGYFGMNVEKGKRYNLSVALRSEMHGSIEVSFEAYGKSGTLGRGIIAGITPEWKTHELSIEATDSDPRARLVFRAPEGGTFYMDCVSLFPAETYGKSGLFRKDLMEKLAALKPSFVRFPGGCWVEGDTMKDAYRWKTTLGSIWERRTQWNIWKYWSSNGVGFHEYLLLCEELGAKPLFCINVGMSHKENVPMEKMDEFVQDALDCIEYCNGGMDTKWGAARAAAGHPEPFNLEYLEIGNENFGAAYTERYKAIAEAVRAKYPDVKLIFNYFKRWNVTEGPRDIRDDHYYDSPGWFMANASRYADRRRFPADGFKVFVGEYAVTRGTRPYGSLRAAIGEAMFMIGLENAQDVVSLAAYAPLFANAQHLAWSPNLINVVSDGCFVSPSWNVQRLFSEYRGKEVLDCRVDAPLFEPGEKNSDGSPMTAPSVAASAVKTTGGAIVLKVVNPTTYAQSVRLNLKGRAKHVLFTGPEADACNSLYDRESLKEVTRDVVLDGVVELPPLSLSVYVLDGQQGDVRVLSFADAANALSAGGLSVPPARTAAKLSELFLTTSPDLYSPAGYNAPKAYGGSQLVHYSVVSLWVNALECAHLAGDSNLVRRLVAAFEPAYGEKKIWMNAYRHVDLSIVGAVPLEIAILTGDARAKELGLMYADRQWEEPREGLDWGDRWYDKIPLAERRANWEKGYSPETRLWIDDMYMITFLQSQAYRLTKERKYIERAAKEMCMYLGKLQRSDGLFDHAPGAPFAWGRGNGWMAAAMAMNLAQLPGDSEWRPPILAGYVKMMEALLKWQRPNGLWGQLVDDPESYDETSATAMFAYAFVEGAKAGILGAECRVAAERAYNALVARLDAHGNLADVCVGTGWKNDRRHYLTRPRANGDPHGQAPLLWLCRALMEER